MTQQWHSWAFTQRNENLCLHKNLYNNVYSSFVYVTDGIMSPQNSWIKSLTPSVTVFGDRTFKKVIKVKWVQLRETLPDQRGWCPFKMRKRHQRPLCAHREERRGDTVRRGRKPGKESSPETESASAMIWNFKPPELWKNKCLLFNPLKSVIMAAGVDLNNLYWPESRQYRCPSTGEWLNCGHLQHVWKREQWSPVMLIS